MVKGNQYYSTNFTAAPVSFREALLKGLAPDSGLYLPVKIPKIPEKDIESFSSMDYAGTAETILSNLIGKEVERKEISRICSEIYNFAVPLENVYGRKYLLRLDQGPTASFKDFAALFMARMMQYFLSLENEHITILTATSGDTGGAVASAFYGIDNINVLILFPEGEVSGIQRKQMTTLGKNIRVIEIEGKFDDCQKLVKQAFIDPTLTSLKLSSANSINIGRLLPQSVYYFHAWAALAAKITDPVVFSVPSGNFGNLAGGIIAMEMGLPVSAFVVAVNENNEFPEYLRTGDYKPVNPSRNCISSAMNVGHPSNLARLITLYGGKMDENGILTCEPDLNKLKNNLYSISVSDKETIKTIEGVWNQFRIILEPHGAVAWYGLQSYLNDYPACVTEDQLCISLETAHPAKFGKEICEILNFLPPAPDSLLKIDGKDEEYISLENNYTLFKEYLIRNY